MMVEEIRHTGTKEANRRLTEILYARKLITTEAQNNYSNVNVESGFKELIVLFSTIITGIP